MKKITFYWKDTLDEIVCVKNELELYIGEDGKVYEYGWWYEQNYTEMNLREDLDWKIGD